jgi:hypothetical protein
VRSRSDERRAELRVSNFPLKRAAQSGAIQRDAEALLIQTLGDQSGVHGWSIHLRSLRSEAWPAASGNTLAKGKRPRENMQ